MLTGTTSTDGPKEWIKKFDFN